jgi:hypothetical protein
MSGLNSVKTRTSSVLLVFFLGCFLQGCRTAGGAAAGGSMPGTDLMETSASAPSGMRLGHPYVSALGEQCREAYPESGPHGGPGAYCLRGGNWVLLPNIYLTVPAAEPYRQP